MVKPTPTPVPAGGYETPSAGINWKLFLLVIGIAGIALAAFALLPSGEGDGVKSGDVADTGIGDIKSNQPAIVTKKNNSKVSVQHITVNAKKERTGKLLQGRTGVLYLYESSILKTSTLSKPYIIGMVIINKDKCMSLEFEGRKFSNITTTFNEYGGIDITGYVEVTSKYPTAVDWSFLLLSGDREIIGASMMHSVDPFGEEDGEFNVSVYISNVNYDINDVKFVAITIRRVDERLEEGYN